MSEWDPLLAVIQSSTQWARLSRLEVVALESVTLKTHAPNFGYNRPYTYELETTNPATGLKCIVLLESASFRLHDSGPFEQEFHGAINNHIHQTMLVKQFMVFGREKLNVDAKLRFVVEWDYCLRLLTHPNRVTNVRKVSRVFRGRVPS